MVLIFDEKEQQDFPKSPKKFYNAFPIYRDTAKTFVSKGIKEVGPKGLLYVSQCEFAVTVPQDNNVSIIGSDDATTCIITILRHPTSGATALAHFDGTDMKDVIPKMIEEIQDLSTGHPGDRIELQLIGGYSEKNYYSEQLFYDVMRIFQQHHCAINLTSACIGNLNTIICHGISRPIIYGAGVDLKTGEVFPATFPERGPEKELRQARLYSSRKFAKIYDSKKGIFMIDPFNYEITYDIDFLLAQDDKFILENLSTSPLVEPPHYVEETRRTLNFMKDHPEPLLTVFKDKHPLFFKRNEDCNSWIPIQI